MPALSSPMTYSGLLTSLRLLLRPIVCWDSEKKNSTGDLNKDALKLLYRWCD